MNQWSLRRARWVLFLPLALAATAVAGGYGLAADRSLPPGEQDKVLARIDSLHVSRQVDSVQVAIEPYLEAARAADDSTFILPLTAKLGRLWASFGQPRRGEPLLREAADMATALEDSLRLCDALRWLGYAVEQQGRSDEAVPIYNRLLAVALARRDRRHEAWARVGLAYRAEHEGRLEAATADYRAAAAIFQDIDDAPAAVWTLNGLGTSLKRSGRYAEAAACYSEVVDLAVRIDYKAVEALAHNNRGSIDFLMGDPGVAMAHFQRAADLQRELSQNQDAVTSGTNVAICLVHLGRLDEATVLLEELVRECARGNFGDRETSVLTELAGIKRLQGESHEARAIYERILARDQALLSTRDRLDAALGLSATLADMDSTDAALAVLVDEQSSWVDRQIGDLRPVFELALGDRFLATGSTARALASYESVIAIDEETAAQGYRVAALAGAARCRRLEGDEQAALRLLRDAASAWEDDRSASRDPEWREQRGAAGRLVYAPLAALILADSTSADAVGRAFDEVQIFKGRTLAERIGDNGQAPAMPAMTLARLQQEVLAADEIFLDAYLGPTESVLFAVTTSEVRATLVPAEQALTRRLRLHHELLATPPPTADDAPSRDVLATAGEQLGRELLGSVRPLLAGRRVVYAPDGALNLVPLAALFPERDPGTPREWTRVPSAAILGHLRSFLRDDPSQGGGVLAFAAATTPAGRSLPGAEREARHLAHRYQNVELRLSGTGGAAVVPEDLLPYEILHLATHARADDQRPWYSEIVLDPGNTGGLLRADRIAEMDLSARLAVLSACETGSGRILSGEGVIGLSSAFLGAGVPAIVATLWPVADATTARLMEHFYGELAAGNGVAAALATAQRAVRSDPATAHPFHWAGFVVVGDGGVTVDLSSRRRPGSVVLALVAVVMIGLVVALRGRRSRAAR